MIYALTSVLLNALAQLAIKYLTKNNNLSLVSLLRSQTLYIVALLYVCSILMWFFALKNMPVSKAYPLQSLGYVAVTVVAWLIFSEKISGYGILGLILICFGAGLVSL